MAEIYKYGKENFGEKTSRRFIKKIISHIKILKENPYIGKIEEELCPQAPAYRSLLVAPYKVIYSVQGSSVRIHFLWHTSRNPKELNRQVPQ